MLSLAGRRSRFKSDDVVINLNLLSLQLDLGLYEEHSGLLNLPFLKSVNCCDKRQLQVEVSNLFTTVWPRRNRTHFFVRASHSRAIRSETRFPPGRMICLDTLSWTLCGTLFFGPGLCVSSLWRD